MVIDSMYKSVVKVIDGAIRRRGKDQYSGTPGDNVFDGILVYVNDHNGLFASTSIKKPKKAIRMNTPQWRQTMNAWENTTSVLTSRDFGSCLYRKFVKYLSMTELTQIVFVYSKWLACSRKRGSSSALLRIK